MQDVFVAAFVAFIAGALLSPKISALVDKIKAKVKRD